MIILGVDPGLADTGWGVVSYDGNNRFQPVSYGVIKTFPDDSLQKRIYTIAEDLGQIATKYNCSVVAMEDIFFTKNISSAIPVAKVIGAAIHKFSTMGLEVNLYSPREIKMAITGMGNADKYQVQDMVKRFLKLSLSAVQNPIADLTFLSFCFLVFCGVLCSTCCCCSSFVWLVCCEFSVSV